MGFDADLVLLATDLREDVAGFADVETTLRGGRIVYQR